MLLAIDFPIFHRKPAKFQTKKAHWNPNAPYVSIFHCQNSMRIDATEVGLIVPLAWFLFTTSFSLFFFTTKDLSFKVSLRTLHPTTAFGVQTWQLTFHSQDPGSNAVVSLPTFREQSSMFWTWWNWCEMVKLVKSESGETSWSDLHVRRSLQHDHQKWNKLVKMLVIQEKLSQKFSMKSSYAVRSDTAKLLSFSSVNLCEISGSGVLLVEWTMWRQRPSTSSMSPTRPVFSRSFSMKGASSANPKLG